MYVSSDALLHVNGDFVSVGDINNNGTINLKGNWTNDSSYSSTGRFRLIGDDQTIDHKNKSFAHLYIGESTIGDKTFPSSCIISDSLVLNAGYIIPTDSSVIALRDEGYVTDGSEDSYIIGSFYNYGTGTKYFPIGTQYDFSPVELHDIEGFDLLCGIHIVETAPETIAWTIAEDTVFGNIYEKIVKEGSFDGAAISIGYTDAPEMKLGRYMSILQADSIQGLYRGIGSYEEATSRISGEFITSKDLATQNFFTLGYSTLAPWELLFVPDALSRNAPDENDKRIKVYGNVFSSDNFKFIVSNQWGNIVFETNSLEKMESEGWDGRNSRTGHRETTGQYNYVIKAVGKDGRSFTDAGSIWIID